MFERVDMNNAYSEYRLDIKFNEDLQGSKAAEFSKAMLGAATLLLVPTVSDMEASFSVSVFHKNQVVKRYAYKTQYSRTASLFLDAQDARKKSIKYLVDLLMKDIQQDAIFVEPKEAATTGKVGMVAPRPGQILGLVTR